MVVFERPSSCLALIHGLLIRGASRIFPALLVVAASLMMVPSAFGEVLFEGYSKILLDGTHVGYVIQRYEFDSKKKEFTTAYFLKTNQLGGNLTESLKARSTASLNPISYQYTSLVGENAKTIDATFKNETMTAVVKENGRQQTLQKKLPKGIFLSSFLGYLMLQGKEGLKKGVKYGYQAIAEEDAGLYAGEAYIAGEEVLNEVSAFKILNTFKGSQFVSFVTHKGEVIATRSPVQKVDTELVASVQEATAGHSLSSSALTHLFGSVPRGVENVVARRTAESTAPAATPLAPGAALSQKRATLSATPPPSDVSPKKEGVPGGQGIMIKAPATPEKKEPEKK